MESSNGTGSRLGLRRAVFDAGRAVAGRVGRELSQRVKGRVSTVDLDDRDPDYIRENLPWLWLLASFYFRADVRGLDRLPADGPVLIVGNHSGGNVTPDTLVFTLAFSAYFGAERRFYQLVHNLVLAMPSPIPLRKYGSVPASHENARAALERDAALLVYPGGDWEVHRPSWESARVDFAGRKGFIKLALDQNVPIVPLVAIGGQETAFFFTRGERLARATGFDRLTRIKVMPFQIAPPFGVTMMDLPTRIPLPAQITIRVLEPIDLDDIDGQPAYQHVTGVMQDALTELSDERRVPILG